MQIFYLFIILFFTSFISVSQVHYTNQDTLMGSITRERAWWDVMFYDLDISVDIQNKKIKGNVKIKYEVLSSDSILQIDLHPQMKIINVSQDYISLNYFRKENVYYVNLVKKQIQQQVNTIDIDFEGIPNEAIRPPWKSGMIWKKDSLSNPWIASTSFGEGSSVWWPCKDHMYDEADSCRFKITVPDSLVAVANGKLKRIENHENKVKTFVWEINQPINTYCINFNIGNYTSFSEEYNGENGILNCEYYVLKQNIELAKKQFLQVPKMLEAMEYWFGAYPFYKDGYKLVEVPYLGMEHQSATAYGNYFKNGYLGRDLSNSGWGNKFDFIIIHESAHEWFACGITVKDVADFWIHEAFTTYAEGLFVEYFYGKKAGNEYQIGNRYRILNQKQLIGNYNVNDDINIDIYAKGSTILHMLRQIVNQDSTWREMLRKINNEFQYKTITTTQLENFISNFLKLDLSSFWNQYLRTSQIPIFEYYVFNDQIQYRWINCIPNFNMPILVYLNNKKIWLNPTKDWKKITKKNKNKKVQIVVNKNFYVPVLNSNSYSIND